MEYISSDTNVWIDFTIALAIAKVRGVYLLTGDGNLRKAAMCEQVKIMGTIGILDRLMDGGYITKHEYKFCLQQLLKITVKKLDCRKMKLI